MIQHDVTERIILLAHRYVKGIATPEELQELERWAEEAPGRKAMLDRLVKPEELARRLRFRQSHDMEADWKAIRAQTYSHRTGRISYPRILRYAAAVMGIFLGCWAFLEWGAKDADDTVLAVAGTEDIRPGRKHAYVELTNGRKIELGITSSVYSKDIAGMVLQDHSNGILTMKEDSIHQAVSEVHTSRIIVPKGGEYKVILSDGTKVWLNSDSKLEFPNVFSGKERRVRLSGEGYFDVSRNEKKPFHVEVGEIDVTVLGTVFNIFAYDNTVRTTLLKGAVKVAVDGKEYPLKPGFEADVTDDRVNISQVDVYERTAWKSGKFVFKDKRLEDVLETLSRWYDFEIFYQNAQVRDLHFTGDIPRHSTIDEVLKFLEGTDLVGFHITGKTVVVSDQRQN